VNDRTEHEERQQADCAAERKPFDMLQRGQGENDGDQQQHRATAQVGQ
jgi:hypothetical protein